MTRQLSNYSVNLSDYNPDSPFHILYSFNNPTKELGSLFQMPTKATATATAYKAMIPVYSSDDNTLKSLDGTNTVFLADLISPELTKYSSYLVKLFPCVNQSVFNSETSMLQFLQQKDFTKYLQPPQPCQTDSTVYCCPNVTGPKQCTLMVRPNFFDTKTVIMMLLILGLVAAILVILADKKK